MHIWLQTSKSQEKINHLMYLDDINLLAKNEKELETLKHTVRIFSQDIGMVLGIEKGAMLVMKSGNRHMMEESNNQIKSTSESSKKRDIESWHQQKSRNERKK